ncbi:hypothetical protein G6F57_002585 [Rhizopus arrhizus]|uniref:RRM domain-containing protein n=1 Tax=Rhizopus oryzae TaxID=64495 RepID=A0A9P7BMW2_RHIOR|nr:hypothetical protein G6F23_006870 [Rhizopus arrhizus]KAG0768343.1 hypothetical protein G6F24_002012 [Rhizopus arrhizus]KAG0787062.1 hypothetical protein G6F22_007435 [Rhizopus arrhizus]KAG0795660.1 hypothetical protein G6F21_001925 [Rhizopus arrhizus]KAG0816422.1 hypothetical protein G6F20_003228 [Rhizopus arrhizus]
MMISESSPFTHSLSFDDISRIHQPLSPKNNNSDDVTTIFVVGFPEDMAEREFQNIFTFCPGFEAASLKWHCKDQQHNDTQGKKQMIGFARFKTRLEALESIEILNGKKIDQEKGIVLKAEMAKKNLHIKRSFNTDTKSSASSSIISRGETRGNSYDGFSPLPSDLLQDDTFMDHSLNDSLFTTRSYSFDQNLSFISRFGLSPLHYHQQQHQHQFINTTTTNTNNSQQHTRYEFKNDAESDPHYYHLSNQELSLPPRMMDGNPPCNTIYVGNLPSITSEDELRALFSNCKGYRRMCFRTKGPMCFVEFEDILCASQAIKDLQGYTLSNSAKSGVRLSFSKNPLYIKPVKEPLMSFKQLGNTLMNDNKRHFMF